MDILRSEPFQRIYLQSNMYNEGDQRDWLLIFAHLNSARVVLSPQRKIVVRRRYGIRPVNARSRLTGL